MLRRFRIKRRIRRLEANREGLVSMLALYSDGSRPHKVLFELQQTDEALAELYAELRRMA